MGLSFAALAAGIYPKRRPIPTDTPKETSTAAGVGVASMPIAVPMAPVAAAPNTMPIIPPRIIVS